MVQKCKETYAFGPFVSLLFTLAFIRRLRRGWGFSSVPYKHRGPEFDPQDQKKKRRLRNIKGIKERNVNIPSCQTL